MPPRLELQGMDLESLDRLKMEVLVVPMYGRRVQPQGVAGCIDWRLCGRLARLVRDGEVTGAPGERHLLGYRDRVGPERICLFGLGAPGPRDAAQAALELASILEMLGDLAVRKVGIGGPHGAGGKLDEPALRAWVRSPALKRSALNEVTFVCHPNPPKMKLK